MLTEDQPDHNMSVSQTIIPASADEMKALEWEQADIIIVTGDAYIDHPAFGAAVMVRLAEYSGCKVAVLPQPNWRDDLRDFKKLGKPRLFFGVTAGCMDSMVNHYTARKRLRSDDAYTPGGKAGFRPDYACAVYSQILKQLFPDTPVIAGGIEASLRRLTHYDYWSDQLKPSILAWSGIDMVLYGMAERAFMQLIREMKNGTPLHKIRHIKQTVFPVNQKPDPQDHDLILPSHDSCVETKSVFAEMFKMVEISLNSFSPGRMIQQYQNRFFVVNPPFPPPTREETDLSFDLPYTRKPHPRYKKKPPIPAYEMIRNSVTVHRGCFGGCAFCAIGSHQGKFIASRSENSVLNELKTIADSDDFKGHITDLGGPSANMYMMQGIDIEKCKKCCRPSCIFPNICNNLNYDHRPLLKLYKKAETIKNIRKITIGSGIRYDMLVDKPLATDEKFGLSEYAQTLIMNHVSGRLKVAPEHVTEQVLKVMRKPSFEKFRSFHKLFQKMNRNTGKQQELVLYLISGHPGSTDEDMKLLTNTTKSMGYHVDTIQEFTPTPMTLSSVMYFTKTNPYTGEKVQISMSGKQIRRQRGKR
jgi:uncharacterized radical SAM protein YgiQ